MDRTEVNASPVQKALQGIKKYKYVLLTALLGVLLLLLPQNEKAADSGSATPSAAENFDREALQNEMETILSSLDGVGKLSLMLTVEGGGAYELAQDETASLKARGDEVDEQTRKTETVVLGSGGRRDPQPLSALCRRARRVRGRRPRGCPAQGDAGCQRADGALVRAHLRC